MGLMDDLNLVATTTLPLTSDNDSAKVSAYYRLRDFIKQHEPWYPPQQEGFGPWIEYRPGDEGPRVGEVVFILSARDRDEKTFRGGISGGTASGFYWRERSDGAQIVAYCVKLDEAKP